MSHPFFKQRSLVNTNLYWLIETSNWQISIRTFSLPLPLITVTSSLLISDVIKRAGAWSQQPLVRSGVDSTRGMSTSHYVLIIWFNFLSTGAVIRFFAFQFQIIMLFRCLTSGLEVTLNTLLVKFISCQNKLYWLLISTTQQIFIPRAMDLSRKKSISLSMTELWFYGWL